MSMHSNRKPLLRFETSEKAQLIPNSSMPSGGKRKKRSGKKSSSKTAVGKKPRVIKGRVNLKVPGYLGLQKVAPSSLIPYLPVGKLRQAARKALKASGNNNNIRVVKRKKKSKKSRAK